MKESERMIPLFEGWEETMIWSYLQGVMGWGVAGPSGRSGLIVNRDFSFLAGEPEEALLERAPGPILVPRTAEWHPLIEAHFGGRTLRETRYAIRKEPGAFDRDYLKGLVSALPEGYGLRIMDEALHPVLLARTWSRDLCSAFDTPAECCRRGLGVAALREGVPVAGAGSYSVYRGGIEIEIDTRPDHRRRGLAAACGAALILLCLERGLYPSWDAADLRSVALAEKLGYHRGESYPVYRIGQ